MKCVDGFRQMVSRGLFLLYLLIGLCSCSIFRADEAPDSGFLAHAKFLTEMRERSPYSKGWVYDNTEFEKLRKNVHKIVIEPVLTSYVEQKIKEAAPTEKAATRLIEDAQEVAHYMTEKFKAAIRDYPNHPLQLVDQADAHTFILELSLVELRPTDPVANTIGTIAGTFLPGGSVIKLAGVGSVAMEGRLSGGDPVQAYVEFKDRKTDKRSLVSLKDFQQYAHVRETIDEWARQFAELSATPGDHKVDDSIPFTLSPI